MFNAIKDFALESVTALLAFFYELPVVGGSFGVAIMLLTATVMTVLMPLTIKATRSTIKMTQLQPELRALQKEYKDDKQELNQAMMALYSENGVNPVGGCLPMLAQLPVFLVLFNVLRGLTRRVSEKPYYTISERAAELTGGIERDPETFDPKYLDHDSVLFQDLSGLTTMDFGPFDLAANAWDIVQNNFLGSIPYLILIAFVVGSSYFQQWQVSSRRGSQPDNPTPQQQTQQQLLKILPLFSGIWSFAFPAGLVLYWATSNFFRIGQQAYITRALYAGEDSIGKKAMEASEKAKEISDSNGSKSTKGNEDVGSDELIGDGKPGRKSDAKSDAKNGSKSGSKNGSKAGSKNGGNRNGSSNGSDKKSPATAGSKNGSGSETAVDRDEAWARRRAQRTKAKESRKKIATEGSSRTTPKGTKPSDSKKKRKR